MGNRVEEGRKRLMVAQLPHGGEAGQMLPLMLRCAMLARTSRQLEIFLL